MSVEFKDTRIILELIESLRELNIENTDTLEDILKKACVLRFIAELEYNFINSVLGTNIGSQAKKAFKKHVLKGITYKSIKSIFEDSFWKEVEKETLSRLKDKYGGFDPKYDAPLDDFVDIRHSLAHSIEPMRQIDINTLKKCIDYMEALIDTLYTKLNLHI